MSVYSCLACFQKWWHVACVASSSHGPKFLVARIRRNPQLRCKRSPFSLPETSPGIYCLGKAGLRVTFRVSMLMPKSNSHSFASPLLFYNVLPRAVHIHIYESPQYIVRAPHNTGVPMISKPSLVVFQARPC